MWNELVIFSWILSSSLISNQGLSRDEGFHPPTECDFLFEMRNLFAFLCLKNLCFCHYLPMRKNFFGDINKKKRNPGLFTTFTVRRVLLVFALKIMNIFNIKFEVGFLRLVIECLLFPPCLKLPDGLDNLPGLNVFPPETVFLSHW